MSKNDKSLGLTTSPPVKPPVRMCHICGIVLHLQINFVGDEKNPCGKSFFIMIPATT